MVIVIPAVLLVVLVLFSGAILVAGLCLDKDSCVVVWSSFFVAVYWRFRCSLGCCFGLCFCVVVDPTRLASRRHSTCLATALAGAGPPTSDHGQDDAKS